MIVPITLHAIDSAGDDYRSTAVSLVVVSRVMGMTFGLAGLSAWGMDHFHVLTSGLEFSVLHPGEATSVFQSRLAEYSSNVNSASLQLFQRFFSVAAIISIIAMVPALGMKRF